MDAKALVYKGSIPDHCCCDQALRFLPDGGMVAIFMTGGNAEPERANHIRLCRSRDGKTWSKSEVVLREPDRAWLLSDVVITDDGRIVVAAHSHNGYFDEWRNWLIESADGGCTWSAPAGFAPAPRRAFLRTLYRATWGEAFWTIQSYDTVEAWEASPLRDGSFRHPYLQVIRTDGNLSHFAELFGRIGPVRDWAECNMVELSDGSLAMLIRNDGSGHLLRSDSADRGRTWSPACRTDIANPGSKFRLHRLRDGRILFIHNDSDRPGVRNPLSLWVSEDDMRTWAYRRVLADFPGQLQYPDGEIDHDETRVHFVFDYNRHDVIYWAATIPARGEHA